MVGYDGSATARAAVNWAARRAGRSGKVYVVHCFTPPVDWYDPLTGDASDADHREHGKAVLDALLLEGADALLEVDYDLELVGGGAADGIATSAEQHDADEIVIGSHGFGRLRAALGSVSQELLRVADRPVIVIPKRAVRERAGAKP